jgi:hypothetical protein
LSVSIAWRLSWPSRWVGRSELRQVGRYLHRGDSSLELQRAVMPFERPTAVEPMPASSSRTR